VSNLPDNWFDRVDEILALASENMKEKLRFQMGHTVGKRKGSLRVLQALEAQKVIFWNGENWVSNGQVITDVPDREETL